MIRRIVALIFILCFNAQNNRVFVLADASGSLGVTCNPASVDDFGTLSITPSILNYRSTNLLNPEQVNYQVINSADGVFSQYLFTHTDVISGLVTYTSSSPLTVIGSSKISNIRIQLSDNAGNNSVMCTLSITVNYNFAPAVDSMASLVINTNPGYPVLIDEYVLSISEKHNLSTWNMNWTNTDSTFNKGGKGIFERYLSGTGWISHSNSLPFPHVII